METNIQNSGKSAATGGRRLRRSRWLWVSLTLVTVGLIGYAGFRGYKNWRPHHLVRMAEESRKRGDLQNAALAARRALQVDEKNVEATRFMAELALEAGARQSLYWWRRLAELQPGRSENKIDWAAAALDLGEVEMAEQALAEVEGPARETAAFHNASGRVALALGKTEEARTLFEQAVAMAPDSQRFALNLAALHLQSQDKGIRDAARETVEQLSPDPALRRTASWALLKDALRNNQWEEALAVAKRLQTAEDAAVEDRIIYLHLLRQFQRPEFAGYLTDLQKEVADDPQETFALLSWMNSGGMALLALEWRKELPDALTSQLPVPVAIAEAHLLLQDWKSLEPIVTSASWGEWDFLRLLYHARVLWEKGDRLASENQWKFAVQAAAGRPEAQALLARTAGMWGWHQRAVDLLWLVARSAASPEWALNALYRRYLETKDTKNLQRVAQRLLELNPDDLWAKNNLACFALLTNPDSTTGHELAKEVYREEPGNPGYVSTYAFSRHLRGNSEEAAELMESLDPLTLADPAYAAYYGTMLAQAGDLAEAQRFLEAGARGSLLPEEEQMVRQAREAVRHRLAAQQP